MHHSVWSIYHLLLSSVIWYKCVRPEQMYLFSQKIVIFVALGGIFASFYLCLICVIKFLCYVFM